MMKVNLIMISIIHKILVLLKIAGVTLKIIFFKKYNRLLFKKIFFFSEHIMMKRSRFEKDFRLKK